MGYKKVTRVLYEKIGKEHKTKTTKVHRAKKKKKKAHAKETKHKRGGMFDFGGLNPSMG